MANVKTVNGLARANVKSRNGLASANIKTINGVDAVVAGGPFGGLVATTNLVDSWPLSEASGTRVGVHAGLDLTDNNTVTGGNDGVAYSQFTAANNEYLERTSEASLQTGDIDYYICGWIYLSSKTTYMHFWSKRDLTGTNQREFVAWYDIVADRLKFTIENTVPAAVATATADNLGSPSTATWMFVETWCDAAGNLAGIQVNRGTGNTGAHTGSPTTSTGPFRIGSDLRSGTQFPHNGRMRRVNFFKRIPSSGERDALYNSGNGLDY